MVFTYVTGRSTDSTEQGPVRWARVKGKTENDLLKLPFKAAYMFRPAGIQPLHGVRSKTVWVQAIYVVTAPLLSYLARNAPKFMTTSEQLGRAMIKVARDGYPKPMLESEDINSVSDRHSPMRNCASEGARSASPESIDPPTLPHDGFRVLAARAPE